MISLASPADLLSALQTARRIAFSSYMLNPGPIADALEAASRRGAKVTVRLEGAPYRNPWAARKSAEILARLRADGADAKPAAGMHMKAAVVDGTAFLDDRNFTGRDETLLRDDCPADVRIARDAVDGRKHDPPTASFAAHKGDALNIEARLLACARSNDDVVVETESFGYGKQIYPALANLARTGRHVRLLVNARMLHGSVREASAVAHLQDAGVEVRATSAAEKFALCGDRAWLGSADATFDGRNERDWGVQTDDAAVCVHLRAAFESRWNGGERLHGRVESS